MLESKIKLNTNNMYYIQKRLEIAGSHQLNLPYMSPCRRIHGHNWIITIYCKAEELNESGMICDFKEIKNKIHDRLDHQHINDIVPYNPTAENMARWIAEQIPHCYRVDVQESEGNIASYQI